ncbi:MAG: hypothetical protein V3U51_03400 [Thermoplasmata archaeon]
MPKPSGKARKVDTVDLSKLDVDMCKVIKVGGQRIAICKERDKVAIYSVEE